MVRRFLSQHLSYANIVATLALVLVVSGGAYAATQLPKNSVGSKQVKNSSLKAKDFKAGQLPAGATGATGPRGLQGEPGAKGETGEAGPAGPDLLAAGSRNFAFQSLNKACDGVVVPGDVINVTKASYLWASGRGVYLAPGAPDDQSYVTHVTVYLYQDDDETFDLSDPIVADTRVSTLSGIKQAYLASDGWLDITPGPATLQPGTHYRLGLAFSANGASSCSFGAGFSDPTLSWAAFPVPS